MMDKKVFFLLAGYFFFTSYYCDSNNYCENKYDVDWSTINCENINVLKKIVTQIDFSKCIDEELIVCILDSKDEEIFNFVYNSLSDENKQRTFSNHHVLIASIFEGGIHAFKKILPYNEKYITKPKYGKYLIEDIIEYCGMVDVLHDNKDSPISKLDRMIGVQFLEEYFKYDSIGSITITKKLKEPLLFLAIQSFKATKYLIEKGADVNSKIVSDDPKFEDLYYLERFILDLVKLHFSVNGQNMSLYDKQAISERLDMLDLIIDKGGILKNKENNDNPHLFILQKGARVNNLQLLKQIIPRYKPIYNKIDTDSLLRCIRKATDEQVLEYLYSELTDWREAP